MSQVSEHLGELGIEEKWIFELGELIQSLIKKDPAIAAGKALDLSSQPNVAIPLKSFIEGWIGLMDSDLSRFTPLQRESLSLVIKNILNETSHKFAL